MDGSHAVVGLAEVDDLARRVRASRDSALERELVRTRHAAGAALCRPNGAVRERDAVTTTAARFPEPKIPEVRFADLDADALGAALAERGSIIVRGLLDASTTAGLLADSRRALDAVRKWHDGDGDGLEAWYEPFEATEGYSFGVVERAYASNIGGCLTVESPRVLARMLEAFEDCGLLALLGAHLGERPLVSAKKTTIRLASAASPAEWHQDGAFLGAGRPIVNAWVPLTPCGIDAPGIDVYPVAYDTIVPTGTDDALYGWSVSDRAAQESSPVPFETPTFGAGDALLFNQMTLHRSSVRPTMTDERVALESWFFVPSDFPHEQVPIAF